MHKLTSFPPLGVSALSFAEFRRCWSRDIFLNASACCSFSISSRLAKTSLSFVWTEVLCLDLFKLFVGDDCGRWGTKFIVFIVSSSPVLLLPSPSTGPVVPSTIVAYFTWIKDNETCNISKYLKLLVNNTRRASAALFDRITPTLSRRLSRAYWLLKYGLRSLCAISLHDGGILNTKFKVEYTQSNVDN